VPSRQCFKYCYDGPKTRFHSGDYRVFPGRNSMGTAIGTVRKVDNQWAARSRWDPEVMGMGRTRDEAVDDLLEKIGGLG
jgi:hypothetical protein